MGVGHIKSLISKGDAIKNWSAFEEYKTMTFWFLTAWHVPYISTLWSTAVIQILQVTY